MSDTERHATCSVCTRSIELLNDGSSRWWVHLDHPADGHDALTGRVSGSAREGATT